MSAATPTKPSDSERDRRWDALRRVQRDADVGVVIASSDLGDMVGYQRYISGYRSFFGDVATMLFETNGSAMIVTNAGVVNYAQNLSWIDDIIVGMETKPWLVGDGVDAPVVSGTSVGAAIGEQLNERGITRIGLADEERFPGGWRDEITKAVPGCTFVDLRAEINGLRLVKSDEEIENIRNACRISDEIWAAMSDIVRVGRREYEVLADLEHRVMATGCEQAFNMCFSLPMFSKPVDSKPSAQIVEAGDTYIIEVSPRFAGYYGQQTGLVSLGPLEPEMRQAYEAINRARDMGIAEMRPGNDLTAVVEAIDKQLTADGYELASPLIGHFVGLELEEPRAGASSLTLEAGMVFICHPFLNGWPALMRADTYLVTEDGAERLTTQPMDPLEL